MNEKMEEHIGKMCRQILPNLNIKYSVNPITLGERSYIRLRIRNQDTFAEVTFRPSIAVEYLDDHMTMIFTEAISCLVLKKLDGVEPFKNVPKTSLTENEKTGKGAK